MFKDSYVLVINQCDASTFRLWKNLPMQRALLGSTLQVTKLNEVLKLCVAAAAPSPEEGAPVGPDTDVEELEEEPSG